MSQFSESTRRGSSKHSSAVSAASTALPDRSRKSVKWPELKIVYDLLKEALNQPRRKHTQSIVSEREGSGFATS